MNIKEYTLRYSEHTDGEDSLYRHVDWTSNYDCPVNDLIPCEDVPFKPDKRLSDPGISCIAVTDTEIVLQYSGYTGDGSQGTQTIQVKLSPQNPKWGCFFGGGRYDTDRSLMLIKPEEK